MIYWTYKSLIGGINVEFIFDKQKTPEIYKRDNKSYYLDPIRKKLIQVTPEETVRQKWINFILEELKVPDRLVTEEEHLSHYGSKSKRRADIIIQGNDKDGYAYPLCIIECKAPEVPISEITLNQAFTYCDEIEADYAIVSNGYVTQCFKYDNKSNEYIRLAEIPTYKEILAGEYIEYDFGDYPERLSFDSLKLRIENGEYDEYISLMTPKEIALPAYNLLECFLDYRICIPTGDYGMFTIIKDYGVRMLSYGNHSGGVFSGPYRSFLIDFNGNTEFVSFAISTYGSYSSDIEKTVLNVAIDNDEGSHHSLQLVLEDNLIIHDGICDFYHHGKIAIGNIGSGKISELQSLVEEIAPDLIDGNKFYFGSLPIDCLWSFHDNNVIELITNLICYALIRDVYRRNKKRQK